MKLYREKKPFVITIFGASGDLAQLELFPALYRLAEQKRFPEEFFVIGFARTEMTQKKFKKFFENSVKKEIKDINPKILKKLLKHIYYHQGQYDQQKDFENLNAYIDKLTNKKSITKIAYFAVPPVTFKNIVKNLGETKKRESEDIRLVIEKPFGEDMETATDLFHFISRYFEESQVYLLDHYLGKSAVQSILPLRHPNRMLNLILKGREISNIQITAFEDIGVINRMGYFDQVGIIKDMMQSHLFQVLALLTMSIPINKTATSIHQEKYAILSALEFQKSLKNIALGQYEKYPKKSNTETFAALRLGINQEVWHDTPIYVRTGKDLDEKHTYVVVEIRKFDYQPKDEEPNRLIIELAPDEKVSIKLINSSGDNSQPLMTEESIACSGDNCLPEHGLLILDVLRKRQNNFLSFPEIIATWKLTDEIVNFMKNKKMKPEIYKKGSRGPDCQNAIIKEKHKWYDLHK